MHRARVVIGLAVIGVFAITVSSQAAIPPNGKLGDANFSLVYNPTNGDLAMESGWKITTLEIKSADALFQTEGVPKPPILSFQFDVWAPAKISKLEPAGFAEFHLDGVLPQGLTCVSAAADLSVEGSGFPSGGLPGTPDLLCIPEPAAISLLGLAGLWLATVRPWWYGCRTAGTLCSTR